VTTGRHTGAHYTIEANIRVLIEDLGLSLGNVLRRAALPADLLSAGPKPLDPDRTADLWEATAAEADDPALPVRIGQAISVESFSPPVFAAICSPNLLVSASRIARYKALIGPLRLTVATVEEGVELAFHWPAHHRVPEILTTTELVWWVALARLATRSHVVPVAVESISTPAAPQAVADYLGVPVRSAGGSRSCSAPGTANARLLTTNESTWQSFEPELRRRLADLDRGADPTQRVRAALLELLPSGRGTVDAVARELAVSIRTLQRQLRSEGTTFQEVLGRTRESLARHYLTDARLSDAEIAFPLGYDEPNSFTRAFRAWTGKTPHWARAAG
jgi:AraC-like DNA-binding protein